MWIKLVETLGKYEIVRRLAVGGMAELYVGRQSGPVGFEKTVVIKRLHPSLSDSPEIVEMFLNEARIAARLNHPNCVQIYDLGEAQGAYFIAMEYINGPDLTSIQRAAKRKKRHFTPGQICYVMSCVSRGLHHAHQLRGANGEHLRLVHRDVSPHNVLVTYAGDVKLVDFGVAKANSLAAQTQAGVLKGKFAYMSPEQCQGEPVDARSDVFAAGILLHELLTRRRLFRRNSDFATMRAVLEDPVPPPSSIAPTIPAVLDQAVLKALERDPAVRYQSAQELQTALDRAAREADWHVGPQELSDHVLQLFPDQNAPFGGSGTNSSAASMPPRLDGSLLGGAGRDPTGSKRSGAESRTDRPGSQPGQTHEGQAQQDKMRAMLESQPTVAARDDEDFTEMPTVGVAGPPDDDGSAIHPDMPTVAVPLDPEVIRKAIAEARTREEEAAASQRDPLTAVETPPRASMLQPAPVLPDEQDEDVFFVDDATSQRIDRTVESDRGIFAQVGSEPADFDAPTRLEAADDDDAPQTVTDFGQHDDLVGLEAPDTAEVDIPDELVQQSIPQIDSSGGVEVDNGWGSAAPFRSSAHNLKTPVVTPTAPPPAPHPPAQTWTESAHTPGTPPRPTALAPSVSFGNDIGDAGPPNWSMVAIVVLATVFVGLAIVLAITLRGSALPPRGSTSAAIVVNTTPPGARVFLDGKEAPGRSPLVIPNVATNRPLWVVALKKGHESQKEQVILQKGQQLTVNLQLAASGTSRAGRAQIRVRTVPPGADIFLDGTRVGAAPFVLKNVTSGVTHSIVVRRTGYHNISRKIAPLAPGANIEMVIHLKPVTEGERKQ